MPHTPGPWIAEVVDRSDWIDIVRMNGKSKSLPFAACKHFDQEANAKLIAAAPDLLAACQFMMRKVEDVRTEMRAAGQVTTNQDEAEVAMIQAAIDKATK